MSKTTITIEIDTEALEQFEAALVQNEGEETQPGAFKAWLEHELNNNTDTVIEMLLSDF